jgi:hypothetical protein
LLVVAALPVSPAACIGRSIEADRSGGAVAVEPPGAFATPVGAIGIAGGRIDLP